MDDIGSIGNDLEVGPSGRNEGHMVMVVDKLWMTTNKWEVMKVKLNNHVKDVNNLQTTMLLLKDLERSCNHSKNNGRTTLCLKTMRNGLMWK